MKSILLIGLGRFGRHIAEELNKLGHDMPYLFVKSSVALNFT